MAGNEKNFAYFTYVDDGGTSWNKRGESGGAGTAVDGHAAAVGTQPLWHETRRNSVRKCRAQEPTTGRTVEFIVYTTAAFAAINLGDTVAVAEPGDATAVNYTVVDLIGEHKQGVPAFSHHLADI